MINQRSYQISNLTNKSKSLLSLPARGRWGHMGVASQLLECLVVAFYDAVNHFRHYLRLLIELLHVLKVLLDLSEVLLEFFQVGQVLIDLISKFLAVAFEHLHQRARTLANDAQLALLLREERFEFGSEARALILKSFYCEHCQIVFFFH